MAKTGNSEQEGTAEGAVLGRATHSLYAKPPVFDDFWAVELLSEATQALVRDACARGARLVCAEVTGIEHDGVRASAVTTRDGRIDADANAQLKRIEGWLSKRPEDPVLLLAAARLSVRSELWGKARSYFETSNAIRPLPETWHELGQLMLSLGDEEAASRAFG